MTNGNFYVNDLNILSFKLLPQQQHWKVYII